MIDRFGIVIAFGHPQAASSALFAHSQLASLSPSDPIAAANALEDGGLGGLSGGGPGGVSKDGNAIGERGGGESAASSESELRRPDGSHSALPLHVSIISSLDARREERPALLGRRDAS